MKKIIPFVPAISIIALAIILVLFAAKPLCREFQTGFPQSAEEASKIYEVDVNRIEMFDYDTCSSGSNYAIWAFTIYDGPEVTINVPQGGEIVVYAGKSYDEATSDSFHSTVSFYVGSVTGTRMFVSAKPLGW